MRYQFQIVLSFSLLGSAFAQASDRYLIKWKDAASPPVTAGAQNLTHLKMSVLEIPDDALQAFAADPRVEFVEKDQIFPAPAFDARYLSSQAVEAPWGLSSVRAPQAWNEGFRGQGARVMVLDSGVDAAHPDLRGRLEAGQDFTNEKKPDLSDKVGHGTHVSGTILSAHYGVAPAARLLMAKVCDPSGCNASDIVKGLDWAVAQKVDVVNLSIGSAWSSQSVQSALQSVERAGIVAVVAAGNENKNHMDFPANVPDVVAVGAVTRSLTRAIWNQGQGGSNYGEGLALVAPGDAVSSTIPVNSGFESHFAAAGENGSQEIASVPMRGSPLSTAPIAAELVDAGVGDSNGFDDRDLSGKIVFVRRDPKIKFREKVRRARNAKALAVVIANDAAGLPGGNARDEDGKSAPLPFVMIDKNAGDAILAKLIARQSVRATLSVTPDSYGIMSGTSMAAPHVTGVVALMRAANPALTPTQVRALLKRTATPIAPVLEYGAGLVNAEAAAQAAQNAR